jgi:hypothetical protein
LAETIALRDVGRITAGRINPIAIDWTAAAAWLPGQLLPVLPDAA